MSLTRRSLLATGLLAAMPVASRAAGRSDVDVLEDLLLDEHRLAAAYEAAFRRDAIDRALGTTLLANERDHVRGLERSLAGAGRREPRASVPDPALARALTSRERFARYAYGLETDTLAAYERSLPVLGDPELRRALGSIMVCGGTHQVALREALGAPLLLAGG